MPCAAALTTESARKYDAVSGGRYVRIVTSGAGGKLIVVACIIPEETP